MRFGGVGSLAEQRVSSQGNASMAEPAFMICLREKREFMTLESLNSLA